MTRLEAQNVPLWPETSQLLYSENEVLTLSPGEEFDEYTYAVKPVSHDPEYRGAPQRKLLPLPTKYDEIQKKQEQIASSSWAVVRIFSEYQRSSDAKNLVTFVGTGFFIGSKDQNTSTMIATARHNVRWTKDEKGILYELKRVYATRALEATQTEANTDGFTCEVLTKLREMDSIKHCWQAEERTTWSHFSDFAILQSSRESASFFLIPSEVPHFKENDKMLVFGYPAYITEEKYKGSDNKHTLSYSEWSRLFHMTQNLIFSHGEFKRNADALCSYNPNTTGGMSGGPVVSISDPHTVVGIHVGGIEKENFFVPIQYVQHEITRVVKRKRSDKPTEPKHESPRKIPNLDSDMKSTTKNIQ